MSKAKKPANLPRRPERKLGPFQNGIGIAIWLNRVETPDGPRFFRSITINSRRYRDSKTGEWRDAASFRPVDLAVLELAIASARSYIASVPLPGQPVDGEEFDEMHGDSEVLDDPFA